jgi:parvulin-like peptidyl-prolyl isomerase
MEQNDLDNEKKIKLATIFYAILVVIVIAVGIGSILAYGTQTAIGEKIAAVIEKTIPFPAAIVDYKHIVFLNDVGKNLASIEKFYQSQDLSKEGLRVDFTTEDGKKRLEVKRREIMDKLVEDKIIEILAKNKGISISKKDIDDAVNQKLAEYGTADDVKNSLLNSYGWSLEDFKQRVILPTMYKEALATYVADQKFDDPLPKEKIEKAQKELASGKDFAQVAKDYSEGSSRENGGELGWVKKNQVILELQDVLFGSKPFEKNSIVESSIGFHIVEVENQKKENGEDVLQLRQIFIAKNTFADWLEIQKKQMRVWVPLREFTWNNSTGSVDFRSEQMRTFEKDERSKAQGDASIMF